LVITQVKYPVTRKRFRDTIQLLKTSTFIKDCSVNKFIVSSVGYNMNTV